MRGFTLIEAVVYLGILSLMIVAAIGFAQSASAAAASSAGALRTEEDGMFIVAKLRWLASNTEVSTDSGLSFRSGIGTTTVYIGDSKLILDSGTGPEPLSELSARALSARLQTGFPSTLFVQFTLNGTEFTAAYLL